MAMTCQVIDWPHAPAESAATFNQGAAMHPFPSPAVLRAVLWADAASGAATAVLQLSMTDALAQWLGLPLLASGAVLWLFVALAASLASRPLVPPAGLKLLVIGNWAWVAGCVVLLLAGTAGTTLGQAYLVLQAVAVAVLAELQWLALKRQPQQGWA
jgi:hypothetical protein